MARKSTHEPAHELSAAEKKNDESTYLSELFYCFAGIIQRGNCVCLARSQLMPDAPQRKVTVVFIFKNCFRAEFSLPFTEECSEFSALKVTQSALLPAITNLAFQQFRLAAALLAGKVALLDWEMAIMPGSRAAPYGSLMPHLEPCPPIRTRTS